MDDVTDRMADAAARTLRKHTVNRLWDESYTLVRDVLSAALDVAPTVDGWVWCEHLGEVWTEDCGISLCVEPDCCNGDVCPGPHRRLLIGPTGDNA